MWKRQWQREIVWERERETERQRERERARRNIAKGLSSRLCKIQGTMLQIPGILFIVRLKLLQLNDWQRQKKRKSWGQFLIFELKIVWSPAILFILQLGFCSDSASKCCISFMQQDTVAVSKDLAHNQNVTNSRIYVHAATQAFEILKIFVISATLTKKGIFCANTNSNCEGNNLCKNWNGNNILKALVYLQRLPIGTKHQYYEHENEQTSVRLSSMLAGGICRAVLELVQVFFRNSSFISKSILVLKIVPIICNSTLYCDFGVWFVGVHYFNVCCHVCVRFHWNVFANCFVVASTNVVHSFIFLFSCHVRKSGE